VCVCCTYTTDTYTHTADKLLYFAYKHMHWPSFDVSFKIYKQRRTREKEPESACTLQFVIHGRLGFICLLCWVAWTLDLNKRPISDGMKRCTYQVSSLSWLPVCVYLSAQSLRDASRIMTPASVMNTLHARPASELLFLLCAKRVSAARYIYEADKSPA
jgi:hypothetical protein